jgi:hypothetical protein
MDQFNFMLRRRNAMFGFLLEGVQNSNNIIKARCVDAAIGSAVVILNNFNHAAAPKPPSVLTFCPRSPCWAMNRLWPMSCFTGSGKT